LKRLDSWVLATADQMSAYYEEMMTVYERDKVLNEAGSVFFAMGIPELAKVRPHLFLNPALWTVYDPEVWGREYEEAFKYEELLGGQIVGDASIVSDMFGFTSPQHFLQIVFFGVWLIASAGVAAVAGSAALMVSIPFLLIGVFTGLIPLTVFAVIGSIFVLVLVYVFWWRGT